jgi:hypothetical protein
LGTVVSDSLKMLDEVYETELQTRGLPQYVFSFANRSALLSKGRADLLIKEKPHNLHFMFELKQASTRTQRKDKDSEVFSFFQ